ncbi:hypothetical protein DIPPA_13102 [Diplonema papillatum]|nr:hypothetical protein DIPPA_13102 [Diplonema papillatum]
MLSRAPCDTVRRTALNVLDCPTMRALRTANWRRACALTQPAKSSTASTARSTRRSRQADADAPLFTSASAGLPISSPSDSLMRRILTSRPHPLNHPVLREIICTSAISVFIAERVVPHENTIWVRLI